MLGIGDRLEGPFGRDSSEDLQLNRSHLGERHHSRELSRVLNGPAGSTDFSLPRVHRSIQAPGYALGSSVSSVLPLEPWSLSGRSYYPPRSLRWRLEGPLVVPPVVGLSMLRHCRLPPTWGRAVNTTHARPSLLTQRLDCRRPKLSVEIAIGGAPGRSRVRANQETDLQFARVMESRRRVRPNTGASRAGCHVDLLAARVTPPREVTTTLRFRLRQMFKYRGAKSSSERMTLV